ncbi:MAG: hypothetical protein GQ573_00045, partial [Gammaproteobacteria bacterium]|nr:hypothetical protein [Gammaproteobacteria bacterium]
MLRLLLIFLPLLVQLTSCAWAPGLYYDQDDFEKDESVEEPEPLPVTLIPITPSLIEKQYQKSQTALPVHTTVNDVTEYEYKVGPQDVLNIIVWDHPELTIPT